MTCKIGGAHVIALTTLPIPPPLSYAARLASVDHGRRIRHGLHKTAILNRDENINDRRSM